jgi:hypothetical protein
VSEETILLPERNLRLLKGKAEETSIGSLTSVSEVLNSENEGTLEFSGAETMGVDDGSVSMVKSFWSVVK